MSGKCYCNLIDTSEQITNNGFEFLLKNKKDQLWIFLINSIKYFSKDYNNEKNLLLILMEIVMKDNLKVYECDINDQNLIRWYTFFDAIGIFYILGEENGRMSFILNNIDLFDNNDNLTDNNKEKYLILETNFKIYAYTAQSYEKSVLSLFSKTICTFPNMIKACLDEESIVKAFNRGITAKQIIKYLNDYSSFVPVNMINQIEIWERKQHRITLSNGYLYHDFIHLSDYLKLLKFIEHRGALIYKDEQKRIIVGQESAHEKVKEFIKRMEE